MGPEEQEEPAVLSATESLCPQCLRRIPAFRGRQDGAVYLVKSCPQHGVFRSVIWRGEPDYASWCTAKPLNRPSVTQTVKDKGCPLDCGLCSDHAQQTCCVLLEVTSRCNLNCPVCFASSGETPLPDPSFAEIEGWLRLLEADVGLCNIQLSGGEPTLRDDLPEIITKGRELGFSFFQLNTNGLRLGSEPGYARRLREAGLSTVFLQFDGLDDDIYQVTRGRSLVRRKEAAIAACAEAGLGIILVPTLIPGVNVSQIGQIVDYALGWLPHVRGVHFQPISYFGRYPQAPADELRYTLPELMRDLERQTAGLVPASSLYPSGCGHSLCSFSGDFLVMPDGSLSPLTGPQQSRACCGNGGNGEGRGKPGNEEVCSPGKRESAAERQRDFVARRWSPAVIPPPDQQTAAGEAQGAPAGSCGCCTSLPQPGESVPSLDEFLARVRTRTLTITAMAFQDVWTLDLERLRNCHLHVMAPGGRLVPFCAYNLTDAAGRCLHRPTAEQTATTGAAR